MHNRDATGPAAERRRWYRRRPSLAARVDEREDHVVIDRRFPGREEHAALLDQACSAACGHELRAGAVRSDVNLGAGEQAQRVIRAAISDLLQVDGADGSIGERARTAAATYADLPSLRTTATGRRAAGCTLRHIDMVCDWLVEHGAAWEAKSLGPDSFQLTDRFRMLVGDSAGSIAFEVLRTVRREQVNP